MNAAKASCNGGHPEHSHMDQLSGMEDAQRPNYYYLVVLLQDCEQSRAQPWALQDDINVQCGHDQGHNGDSESFGRSNCRGEANLSDRAVSVPSLISIPTVPSVMMTS